MRRFVSMCLLVAAIPFLVAVAEVVRSYGSIYHAPAMIACVVLLGVLLLLMAPLSEGGAKFSEKLEVLFMWLVLGGFVLASYFVWGVAT